MVALARLAVDAGRPGLVVRVFQQRGVQRHDELLPSHAHQKSLQRRADVAVSRVDAGAVEAERDFVVAGLRQREPGVEFLQLGGAGLAVDIVQEFHPLGRGPLLGVQPGGCQLALEPCIARLVERRKPGRDRTDGAGGNARAVQPLVELGLAHHLGVFGQQLAAQVVDELAGGDTLEGMLVEPAAEKAVEHGAARALLEGAQEPGAFRIRQRIVGIGLGVGVRILRQQGLLRHRHGLEQFERFFLLELQVHGGDFIAVQNFEDAGRDVGGEAFIEPPVLPRCVGYQVARPAVRQFVGDQVDQAAVARDHGRRQEGQAWIFHAADRERRRQHQHVVTPPAIRAVQRFGGGHHFFGVGQFVFGGLDPFRLGVHAGARAELAVIEFADADRQQVGRNRLRHGEAPAALAAGLRVVIGAHHHAQAGRRLDAGGVGEAHRRRVLQRHPRARVDGLGLAEHEGPLARHGLLRREPLQRGGARRGAVADAHLRRLAGQGHVQGLAFFGIGGIELVERVRRRRPTAVNALRLNAGDGKLARVEVERAGGLVDPLERKFSESRQRLAGEISLQVDVQGARFNLVVVGVTERVKVNVRVNGEGGRAPRGEDGGSSRAQDGRSVHRSFRSNDGAARPVRTACRARAE